MLTQFIRVFKGAEDITDPLNPVITLTDVSMDNSEKSGITIDQKYIYIAQKFPFNNIFMLLGSVVNTVTSKIKIEYWNGGGKKWMETVDNIDFSKGLKKHGLIQFSLQNLQSWDVLQWTDATSQLPPNEMKGLGINDCYWLRISYDVAPDPTTQIKSIGYCFTTTEKVNAVDTQATRYYDTFQTGKADWLEEILIGSEMMIADMKTAGFLKSHGQIIMLDDYYLPCAYRVLMHIYSQMGTAYEGRRGEVSALYKNFMKGPKTLDENMDGRIQACEQGNSITRMKR